MGTTANTGQSTWEQIHGGVRETERLIGQKNYNLAMVKARQTLEYMVKCLCERYGILETGLLEMIDALYSAGKISKTTCEHYHKIRTIGNKAIHEGDNSAYNANQAHHLLSQEVYTFANDYNDTKKSTRASRSASSNLRFFPPSREPSAIPLPALETENLPERVPATPRDAVRAPMQAVRLLNFEALLNQCF